MHQAKKSSKEIAETTKIGLRTVQHIIQNAMEEGLMSPDLLFFLDRLL